jgi:hypothetical protein
MNNNRPFTLWAQHIQNQLESYEESGRTIHRADIKWPKGRKVSSHFAIELDTSGNLQQTEGKQEVYTTSI